MSMDRECALDYLRTPPGAPWRWEDGGRALVWKDGATIVFREELELIFERLAPGGLPAFPALVCVLAACRGRYLEFPGAAKMATAAQASRVALGDALSRRGEQPALEQLQKLAMLPRAVIGNPRGKALLAQIVFEATERAGGVDAAQVARGLKRGLSDRELNAVQADAKPLDIAGTVHRAAQPLRVHTAETLRLRLRTGLDVLPEASVAPDLPRGERARRLLAKLAEDDERRGLALMVCDLMAALRLPSVLARADEQAAGGASGLGNRGTLDRLLLSELAHDDLTLATRVALNEALYLHREPPARRPRRGLALLLDPGLRMWGIPRVLGTATGLALLAGWPDEAKADAWRADDKAATPVDLLDEKALTEHLAVLGTTLDPSGALPAFWAHVAERGETDAVIVTHKDVVRVAAFQRQLAQGNAERGFLVLVDGNGLVELHALPWGGARPLAQMQADLAKLFAGEGSKKRNEMATPPVDPALSSDLPAIFRVKPFPLLLPVTGKLERTVEQGAGGLCVTADRRLFRWEKVGQGARQLLADLSGGRTCWLAGEEDGRITLVRGRDGSGKMAVISLAADKITPQITRLTGPHHVVVYRDRTALLLVMHTRVAAVALDGSAQLGETPTPDGFTHVRERYFKDAHDLWFATWNGAAVQWEKTEMGRHLGMNEILCAFERDGVGPWVLTRNRRILSPAGHEWMRLEFDPGMTVVRSNGNELLITTLNGSAQYMADLNLKKCRFVNPSERTDSATFLTPPSRQLQSRIRSIHAAPGQPLRLRNAKGKWLEIFASREGLRLVEAANGGRGLDAGAKLFTQITTPASLGCSLKRAVWADGSVAWLDDRGLLHLRSRNQEVPELALVLSMGTPLAAWTSDGTVSGPEFFTGKKNDAPSDSVLSLLSRFSNALC